MSADNTAAIDARTQTDDAATPRCDACGRFTGDDHDCPARDDDDARANPYDDADLTVVQGLDVDATPRADARTLWELGTASPDAWHNDRRLSFTEKQNRVIDYAARNPGATLDAFDRDDAPASPQYARDVLYRLTASTYETAKRTAHDVYYFA